ncbi:MAG: MFS transporter [Anaerolineae bacterium]|jgi:MFS family permease
MQVPSLQLAGARGLLKNQHFGRLLAAQFSAVTVIYGLSLAGAVLVEEQTQSSAGTGLVILSAILPAFLGSIISGTVVDRWGRKRVLLASHLGRALVALCFFLGVQTLPIGPALVLVYAINAATALLSQFATPAELALLPDLVDAQRLVPANAVFQLSWLAGEGLGIILLSPVLIKVFGVPSVGLVGAGLCFLAAILVAALPRSLAVAKASSRAGSVWSGLVTDLKAGWLIISRDGLLRLVAIQATVAATLLLVLLSLLPGLLSRHLGLAVEDAPLLVLPGGLGFVLGAWLLSRQAARFSRPTWIAMGLVGIGVSTGLLSLAAGEAAPLWLILPIIFALGAALALTVISARVVLQERPPADKRARVIAAQLALANAAAVVPLLLGGSVADSIGIRPVMAVLGLLALAAGLAGWRHARRTGLGETTQ